MANNILGILVLIVSIVSEKVDTSKSCDFGFCNYNTNNPCCASVVNDLSAGEIAGIVIGCVVGFGIFIILVICVCNANRRQNGTSKCQENKTGVSDVTVTGTIGQLQKYPLEGNEGNTNAGYTMGPTFSESNMENDLEPSPYSNIIEFGYTKEQVESVPTSQHYTSLSHEHDSAPHDYTRLTPQTNISGSAPLTESNYYSTISDSSSPSTDTK